MAHNLAVANGKHCVFVAGEPAWHRLGVNVEQAVTSEEAITLAQLNYEVKKEPVFVEFDGTRKTIESTFATVRTDTSEPLGIVGERYTILQNKNAFEFFDTVVGLKAAMYYSAGALGKGEKIWLMAKLPENIIVKNTDVVEQYLVLMNTHDGSKALKMYYTPVRVVCQNTLNMSLRNCSQGISIRHTVNLSNKITEARRVLGLSLQFSGEFSEIVNQFASRPLTIASCDEYFKSVLSTEEENTTRKENQLNELRHLFEAGRGNDAPAVRHSLWAAYNAVTEYADHYRTVKGETTNPSNRLESIWFGSGAVLKTRAFEKAKQLVTI